MAELGIMIFAAGGTALQLSSSGARNRWLRCGFVSLVDFTGVENFCAGCEIRNAEKCAKLLIRWILQQKIANQQQERLFLCIGQNVMIKAQSMSGSADQPPEMDNKCAVSYLNNMSWRCAEENRYMDGKNAARLPALFMRQAAGYLWEHQPEKDKKRGEEV